MDKQFSEEELKALARLYESRYSLFADENVPVSLRLLAMFLGTTEDGANGILSRLEGAGLIRRILMGDRYFFQITNKGAEEFEYAHG